MKRLCASTLVLLVMTMNCSVLAQENWVFTAPSVTGNDYYTQPIVTTPTYETQLKTTLAEPKKTFSESHPIIAGLGLGVALLGLEAVTLLIDDDDDEDCDRDRDKRRHHNSCNECRTRHRNI